VNNFPFTHPLAPPKVLPRTGYPPGQSAALQPHPRPKCCPAAERESSSDDENTDVKESHFKAAAPESKTIKTIDDLLLEALYAHNSHKITEAIEIYTYILDLKPGEQLQPIIYIHRRFVKKQLALYTLATPFICRL
jgi:hypothetical protein